VFVFEAFKYLAVRNGLMNKVGGRGVKICCSARCSDDTAICSSYVVWYFSRTEGTGSWSPALILP